MRDSKGRRWTRHDEPDGGRSYTCANVGRVRWVPGEMWWVALAHGARPAKCTVHPTALGAMESLGGGEPAAPAPKLRRLEARYRRSMTGGPRELWIEVEFDNGRHHAQRVKEPRDAEKVAQTLYQLGVRIIRDEHLAGVVR